MRALITGANGHIGSNVVRACIDAKIEPVAFVRPSSDRRSLSGIDVELREGDLLDPASVAAAMERVELVLHVGAVHRNWAADEATILRPAIEGTRNVLEAAKRAGVRRVVHTSTGATVGFAKDLARPLDESATAESAKSVYSRGKIEAEKLALATAGSGELQVVVVNPSGVFGPRDYRLTPATRGIIGMLHGDPSMLSLCVTDVRDVAQAHVLAATKGTNGQRYLLTGDLLSPVEIAESFAQLTGIRPSTMRPPRFLLGWIAGAAERSARKTGADAAVTRDQIDDVFGRHLAYDSRRAREELGAKFRPAREVLRDTIRWLLFVDALKPRVAAKLRSFLGRDAEPDASWRAGETASAGA